MTFDQRARESVARFFAENEAIRDQLLDEDVDKFVAFVRQTIGEAVAEFSQALEQ